MSSNRWLPDPPWIGSDGLQYRTEKYDEENEEDEDDEGMSVVIEKLQHDLAITQGDLAKAWMAIKRVRDLHQEVVRETDTAEGYLTRVCGYCDDTLPCDTIRALDGDQG